MSSSVDRRAAFENDNTISEVSCHDEIVLNDEASFLRVKNVAVARNLLMIKPDC